MPLTVRGVMCPALSLTEALADRFAPSPSTVLGVGQGPARPEPPLSLHDQATVTSWLTQPVWLGVPMSVGGVLSTLMPLTLSLALLPAASVTEPLTLCAVPSPSTTGSGQSVPPWAMPIPDRLSPHSKRTVTLSLYHWFALAVRSGVAAMVGSILSILTVAVVLASLPAWSTAVPVTCCPSSLLVSVVESVQLAMPEPFSSSSQVNVTVTFVRFQLRVFGAGSSEARMPGAVRSTFTVAALAVSVLPALSTLQ